MANFNKVILAGNLTRDPQLRNIPSGMAVVEFGLAINRKWKSKEGLAKEETCFVDCQAWGKTAETITQYVRKGQPILVEGRLSFSQWEDKDGQKRSKLRVTVENFQFLGAPQGQQANQGQAQAKPAEQKPAGGYKPEPDDAIPF